MNNNRKRLHPVRPVVLSEQMPVAELIELRRSNLDYPAIRRPLTRGECVDIPRPCPWVSCRHHLFADVTKGGGLKLNYPDLDPGQLAHSCSLDVADAGEHTLESIAPLVNTTRERVRQTENIAIGNLVSILRGRNND